jgi:hypothetical protein
MKRNLTYQRIFIKECNEQNSDFISLFNIFRQTLKPDMQLREFKAYYYSSKLKYIDVTFVLFNQMVIGFCAAAFYKAVIGNKNYTIGRAATGILEAHRGNVLPKWKLYKKYMYYKLMHPFSKCILSAYVANPLIYAMLCKYTGIAYPKASINAPKKIIDIKNQLLRSQNLHTKENTPFVVEIHFCVKLGEKEQVRIFESSNNDVKYYLKINPKFRQQYGVLVIIPVTLKNISFTAAKFMYHSVIRLLIYLYHIEISTKKRKSNFV